MLAALKFAALSAPKITTRRYNSPRWSDIIDWNAEGHGHHIVHPRGQCHVVSRKRWTTRRHDTPFPPDSSIAIKRTSPEMLSKYKASPSEDYVINVTFRRQHKDDTTTKFGFFFSKLPWKFPHKKGHIFCKTA